MRILYFFILLIFFSADLKSQYPDAAGSPHGIYIFLDNHIPGNEGLQIYRSEGTTNNFQLIGKVTAPSGTEELRERILNFEPLFSDLGSYTEEDILKFHEYLSTNTTIDTLMPVNFPVMHLAAGTAYLDQTAEKGKKYRYRIEGKSGIYEEGSQTTEEVSYPGTPAFSSPVVSRIKTDRTNIYIDWSMIADPAILSFRVYRRQNMAGAFEEIEPEKGFYNQGDTLILLVNDWTVKPMTIYEYYIEPLDRLANPGKPSVKTLANSFSQSDVPVITNLEASEDSGAHKINLKWHFSNPESVRGISIYRSDNFDSSFVKIAEVPSTDSIYMDNVPIAMENYYYYLVLNGIMNQGYPSAKVGAHAINNEIPDPPDLFRTETVKGGVKLQWIHTAPEVRGYYIYRDQGRNGELKQVSEFIPAEGEIMTYIDSTEGLLGNLSYRYAIKAVNDGYIMSRLSEVSSTRPGIPTLILPPTNLHGGIVDGNVLLVWDDMYRTNEFLLSYQVYKKRKGESDFRKVSEGFIPFNQNSFTDSIRTEESGTYEYAVSSIDESGQESLHSKTVEVELQNPSAQVFPPAGFRAGRGRDGNELIWAMDEENKNKFHVYRYEEGKEAIKIADLPEGSFNFTDSDVLKGKLYFYYLIAVSSEGRESKPTKSLGLRY